MSNIINYPKSPVVGQQFVVGTTVKQWDGEKWVNTTNGNQEQRIRDTQGISRAQLIAQGLSGNYGFFEQGFNYLKQGDVGVHTDGTMWVLGTGSPRVLPGTTPSAPAYTLQKLNVASNVQTTDGRNVQERLDDLPSEVDAAGTAATLISQHNSDAGAHPELSAFISSEADRAEAASDAAFVNADVYPSWEDGLAATVEGEQFQVLAANGYEYVRYLRTAAGAAEVGRFIGARAPAYGFLSGSSANTITDYSPLVLDTSSQTVTIRGRVVTGTRTFLISEPVTLSYATSGSVFVVVSEEVGGTRLVPTGSYSQIGVGDVIVGSMYLGSPAEVYGAPHYTIDGLHRGRSTVGIFPHSSDGISATWPNDHFWTLTGSTQDVLTLWRNDSGSATRIADIGKGKGSSVSYTLALDTRTELADFNFAGNVIHHLSMRVVLDGESLLVPAQDIALDEPRSTNQTRAVVLNPDTLELSTELVAVVTPASGVVLYYYNEDKREVHTIYPYRIDGTLVKPENGEGGLATTGTVIFNDAESPQLVVVDDSHTLEDPMPLSGAFTDSTLTSATVYGWYDQLVEDFPQYVSRELMGMDASGVYPIYGYRFTPSLALASSNEDTPRVFMCAVHSETLNFVYQHVLMREICRSWDANPRLAALRFGAEFLVMPCANPYGLDGKQRMNSNGVDINRNFPNGWILTEPGAYYSGPSPASEIETQTIINAIDDFSPHVAIDCHAFHGGEDKFVWTPIVDPTYRMATQTACLQVYQKIVKQFPRLEDRTFNSFYNPKVTGLSAGGLISKFFLSSGAIGGTFEVSRNSVGGIYLTNEEIVTGASALMNTVYEGIKTYRLYGTPRTTPQGVP